MTQTTPDPRVPDRRGAGAWRPVLGPLQLNLIVATFVMLAYNATFWGRARDLFEGNWPVILGFGGAVWALTLLLLTLFALRRAQKPVIAILLVLSAVTSYFTDTLGAIIDRDMVQNVVTTTVNESKHLLTPRFFLHVALYGVLPALAVLAVRVRRRRFLPALAWRATTAVAATALCVGLLLANMATYSVVLRANKELMASYQPGAPLSATLRYAKMMLTSRNVEVAPLGTDARQGPLLSKAAKPVLLVLIAGETARAQNFSLDGYGRDTNPELAQRDITYFSRVSSCGTATAVSLPCMFSSYGREDYSYQKGISTENLLDVLARAGFRVEWWDNNTGDKNIADRLPRRSFATLDRPEFCEAGECRDGVFLSDLKAVAETMTQNTVIVLHQIGSHGPAYYLRYPKEYERFTPTCDTSELKNCTDDQIRNTFDNTIAFTDRVLAQTIDMLSAQARVAPAMLYISDHGESLGEKGLYLHGAPYFMAPEEQTRVPMVMWMSGDFQSELGISGPCLAAKKDSPLSHDNLFHSVLGLLDVQTTVRQPALDFVEGCRSSVEATRG